MGFGRLRFPALLACAAVLACSSKDRSFVNRLPDDNSANFDWPDDKTPAPKDLRIEPADHIAFVDSEKIPSAGIPVDYKVIDAATGKDVTANARLAVQDIRYGKFEGSRFIPAVGGTDIYAGYSLIGARVNEKTGFTKVSIVRTRRSGDHLDFVIVVPPGGTPNPTKEVLRFGTGIGQIDVAIVFDTTGSMGASIEDLKTNLRDKLFPALAKQIRDVGMALVDHKDFPFTPYGDASDLVVKVVRKVSTSVDNVRDGVLALKAGGGGDLPEAQLPAMFHTLTGAELKWSSGLVPAYVAPAGKFGAVDFRPGSLPVIVLITDVDWHEAEHEPYNSSVVAPPTMLNLKDAFKKANAKFIDITDKKEAQADDLSDGTNSNVPAAAFKGLCGEGMCCTDVAGKARPPSGPGGTCRLNFLHSGGAGISDSIVNAISGLNLGAVFDVSAAVSNDPTNPGGVDGTKYVKALRAMDEGDAAQGCAPREAIDTNADGIKDTFPKVTLGTPICFEVVPIAQTEVPTGSAPTFFNAIIELTGAPGAVKLDRRTITFLVPASPLK